MRLSQRVTVFASPADHVSHLGPRDGFDDEGPLTLCGLFLAPMLPLTAEDAASRRPCAMCALLDEAAHAAAL